MYTDKRVILVRGGLKFPLNNLVRIRGVGGFEGVAVGGGCGVRLRDVACCIRVRDVGNLFATRLVPVCYLWLPKLEVVQCWLERQTTLITHASSPSVARRVSCTLSSTSDCGLE
jgi:hypothetical protein